MDYTLIYADRRSVSASVKDGRLVVRAPRKMPIELIEAFLSKHERWIENALKRAAESASKFDQLTDSEIGKMKSEAKRYLKEKILSFYGCKSARGKTYKP